MAAVDGTELSAGLLETYMRRFELKKEDILEKKRYFEQMDDDNNGKISMEELRTYNAKFNAGFSEKELSEQFKELDVDGNGGITFVEFLKVYVKGEFGRDVQIGMEHLEEAVHDMLASPSVRGARKLSTLNSIREVSTTTAMDEEADFDGVQMKLTTKKNVSSYHRAARNFLVGSEDRPAVDHLKLMALGEAINFAIAVAIRLQSEGLGRIKKVHTDYPSLDSGRGCPQILIDVDRI